jgi:hypothetical protein
MPDRNTIWLRYAKQCTQVFKMVTSMKNPKVRCYGTQPSRLNGKDHKGCGKWVRIDKAYKCLYCEFWFCLTCAEIHFGKTKEQHKAELIIKDEYHGIV